MKAGDAFHINNEEFSGHLWFVVSDPDINDEEIVIANVTTWYPLKGNDCELFEGDHPFIDKKSVIYYADAQVLSIDDFRKYQKTGELVMYHTPASEELLVRIREGAARSKRLPFWPKGVLSDQGFI